MATTTTTTNKPLNPRAQDLSPKGYNRANIFSGKALSFDGVNDQVTAAALSMPTTTEFSFSCYFKTTGTGVQYIYENSSLYIATFRDSATTAGQLSLYISSGNWIDTGIIVNDGRWYHLVVSILGGIPRIYLNGRLVYTAPNRTYGTSAFSQSFGQRDNGSFWTGQLCNFKIFNVGLTAAQVSDLYLNPEKIVPDGVASSALKLWLPMMEGAGASAYDGSGNGNDGTINGATWTAGIGSPVAQTALVSWDKGQNRAINSENLSGSGWSASNATITPNAATAPNGTLTADRVQLSGGGNAYLYQPNAPTPVGDVTISGWFKGTTAPTIGFNDGSIAPNSINITTEWAYYELTYNKPSGSVSAIQMDNYFGVSPSTQAKDFYAWGLQIRPTSAGDAYIKTNATAQTSAVLVPEGLTAGASIFGTDIITPRNAFALNLDGASWAQVGDNASLDISPAMTMEVWVNFNGDVGNYGHVFVKPTQSGWTSPFGRYALRVRQIDIAWWFENAANEQVYAFTQLGWHHLVVTKNGTAEVLYVDGAQVDTHTGVATITASEFPLLIGVRAQTSQDEFLKTQAANPRIYNRALTAAEVLRNYNADRPKFGL